VRSERNCSSRRGFLHQDFYRQFISLAGEIGLATSPLIVWRGMRGRAAIAIGLLTAAVFCGAAAAPADNAEPGPGQDWGRISVVEGL
jgi:hypothetical protein